MEEKSDKKNARRLAKELRHEFLEENECVELNPKASARSCCGDAFQNFDAQSHDAWLLQCPKGMDPRQLTGKRIKLPGRRYVGDLQVRASNYSTPLNEAVGYVTSGGKYALRKLPVTGYVVVSKRLNADQPDAGQDQLDSGSEFPAAPPPPKYALPVRHPFFGRDYKKRIDVPAAISEALNQADKQNAKTTARLRRTANYYTIRSKMLTTTQTLVEKELDVRQSVLTGLTPGFMKSPGVSSLFREIKQEPEETNGVVQTNGYDVVEIKEEPTTPKKHKKRKSNGEILVNGASNHHDSLVTIKEEVESPPEKRRKRKAKGEEIVILDEEVIVKQEKEEATPRKRKKLKAGA